MWWMLQRNADVPAPVLDSVVVAVGRRLRVSAAEWRLTPHVDLCTLINVVCFRLSSHPFTYM